MISYQPFFDQIAEKKITIYALEHTYGLSKTTLYKIKHGGNVSLMIINDLCKALDCRIEDLIVYVTDDPEPAK